MNLSSVLPDYYDDNETMQELQKILSEVTDILEKDLKKTMEDAFWSRASGSEILTRYEKMFGISPDTGKSDRYRRERIAARVAEPGTTISFFNSAHCGELYKCFRRTDREFSRVHCNGAFYWYIWNSRKYCGY